MNNPDVSSLNEPAVPPAVNAVGFLGDFRFWLALSAGPAYWLGLVLIGGATVNQTLVLPVLTLVLLIVVYPLLEEIVFRGALQGFLLEKPFLQRSLFGLSIANLLTSVLFAVMHLFNHPPVFAFLVFFPSLVFGWARDRYTYLGASIALHAFYNAGYFLLFG